MNVRVSERLACRELGLEIGKPKNSLGLGTSGLRPWGSGGRCHPMDREWPSVLFRISRGGLLVRLEGVARVLRVSDMSRVPVVVDFS